MKKKCEYLEKEKKLYYIIISILAIMNITLFIISADRILCFVSKIEIFDNEFGFFDWGIFWGAIGALGSILGFVGVIKTIKSSEKSRIKQNKYDYAKERRLSEQYDFELLVKTFLDEVDPINSSVMTLSFSSENYKEIMVNVNCYIAKIKSFYSKVQWYYANCDIVFSKRDNFFDFYNVLIGKITNCLLSYNNSLSLYNTAFIYSDYQKLEKMNGMTDDDKIKFSELKKKYNDLTDIYKEITDNAFSELMSIVNFRNEEWFILLEKAKEMLNERDNYIKNSLEKSDS